MRSTVTGRSRCCSVTSDISLLTCAGASVGVSTSTQRRMPSRMVAESKGFELVSISAPALETVTWGTLHACAGNDDIGQIWRRLKPECDGASTLVGALAGGNLLDEIHDRAAQLRIADSGKSLGQRQPFG